MGHCVIVVIVVVALSQLLHHCGHSYHVIIVVTLLWAQLLCHRSHDHHIIMLWSWLFHYSVTILAYFCYLLSPERHDPSKMMSIVVKIVGFKDSRLEIEEENKDHRVCDTTAKLSCLRAGHANIDQQPENYA